MLAKMLVHKGVNGLQLQLVPDVRHSIIPKTNANRQLIRTDAKKLPKIFSVSGIVYFTSVHPHCHLNVQTLMFH